MKNSFYILILIMLLAGCTSGNKNAASPTPFIPEHKYYKIGETISGSSFEYTINSIKVENGIPATEGNKWVVLDITFTDRFGKEDSYSEYASMYGEFVLVDEEHFLYRSYNREQRTPFHGTTRDVILFQVPVSKKSFLLFQDDYFFDKWSDFDSESRDITKIEL